MFDEFITSVSIVETGGLIREQPFGAKMGCLPSWWNTITRCSNFQLMALGGQGLRWRYLSGWEECDR